MPMLVYAGTGDADIEIKVRQDRKVAGAIR